VRKAFLCGEENSHREDWIEVRLRELVDIFAIDCAGFAIMDNHLHLLLRLDSQRAQNWSNEEVAGRWLTLFPVRDVAGKALPICQNLVTELAGNPAWVARVRGRLSNLGWFTKCLKELVLPAATGLDEPAGSRGEGKPRSANQFDLRATGDRVLGVGRDGGQVVRPDEAEWQSLRYTRAAQGGGAGASPPLAAQPIPPRPAPGHLRGLIEPPRHRPFSKDTESLSNLRSDARANTSGAAPAPAPHPTAPGCRRAGCSDWSKLKPRPDKPCKGPEW
jgi:hypothetical protein